MSSVAGLIVPNNFNIASSGGDIAEGLYSDNGNNVINTQNSPNPVADQALVATGPNAATWQTVALPDNPLTMTNKSLVDPSNVVAAEYLHVNGKTQTINVGSQPAPLTHQVLTCTVAPGIFPGEANWQTAALANNTFTMTGKTLISNTNVIAAEDIWCGGKSQRVNLGNAGIPSLGQVLTCTGVATPPSSAAAAWVTPAPVPPFPVNSVQGGFKAFGAATPGTVLTTVSTSGDDFDSMVVVGHIVVCDASITASKAYRVSATFLKVGGVLTLVGASIADDLGGTLAEAPPIWEAVPASDSFRLVKVGATNSRWGGSWTYTTNGITV